MIQIVFTHIYCIYHSHVALICAVFTAHTFLSYVLYLCYVMQAYEWALDAMKYVAGMKLVKDMSTAEINQLRVSLDEYMKEHPAVDADTFGTMQTLAQKLQNDKLSEKCAMAKSRCLETDKLLRVRRSTLRKAEQHIAQEEHFVQEQQLAQERHLVQQGQPKSLNNNNCHCVAPLHNGDSRLTLHSLTRNVNYGEPPSVVIRRRSYAGKAASPVYNPSANAYRESVKDLRLQEQLFRDSVITVDMSCHVVTSLPKNLSDSTLRGSRESLRDSSENLTESVSNEQNGVSLSSNVTRTVEPCSCDHMTSTRGRHPGTACSIQRRRGVQEDGVDRRVNRRSTKTFSMMTGSWESLPG